MSRAFAVGVTGYLAELAGVRGLRLGLNTSVAVLVLSLPFAGTATSRASTMVLTTEAATAFTATDSARAQPLARGVIAPSRNPTTVASEGRGVREVTVHEGDTLATMANYYQVSIEAIAFASGINDPSAVRIGQRLVIPPAEGALYTMQEGDSVEAVAARFKVEPSVILSYNRCYFEPEHCVTGQLVFVRGAQLPSVKAAPTRILAGPGLQYSGASGGGQVARTGGLAWPVAGVVTQYFWPGHTGTDIAAAYGTGIGASDAGLVSATGWVAVGGLRVCLDLASGLTTCYYHTSAVYVKEGQRVARGEIVAAVGMTGVTSGAHVHWECKRAELLVDCTKQ